ncbi:MAG: DUF937 domain-containing protein [Pirellula sp.]|jgi:hypothetical protein|nr:DUF937 domain-containing protein [Pirellula sp.]
MAMNLMDMVKDAITGQVADQLGSAVGLDKKQTASALEAVVPMLLGGMMKKVSTSGGASELSAALRDTDTSMLDNLGGLLGGGSSSVSNMIAMGTKLLPMLLGSSQGNIISALVKMLGINEKTIGSLLGLLAPIVMAVVGKQAKAAGGFDVGALTNLFGSQKDILSKALPSELQGVMGLVGDVSKTASRGVESATRAAEAASSSNPLQWILPLVALAVLGYLGYNFLFNRPQDATTAVAPTTPVPEVPKVDLPDLTDLKKSLSGNFEILTNTLEGIKDVDGAKSALTKIEEAASSYNKLGVDKLPAAAQTLLGPFIKPYLTRLLEVVEGLYKIPGVKDVIEPVLGPMVKAVQAVGA